MGKLKHGFKKGTKKQQKFYCIWKGIKKRCLNKNDSAYFKYGGRGIRVCKRWLNFINFKEDMWKSFLKGLLKYSLKQITIDRINNSGNYELFNCRWANYKIQANNRRNNIFIWFNDKKQTLAQWIDELNLDDKLVRGRLKQGWSFASAINTPKQKIIKQFKNCLICNKRFFDKPSYLKERRTCGKKCLARMFKKTLLGQNNPNYKHGKYCL